MATTKVPARVFLTQQSLSQVEKQKELRDAESRAAAAKAIASVLNTLTAAPENDRCLSDETRYCTL